MISKTYLTVAVLLLSLSIISCKKKGCTDPVATNYSASADLDDGSCNYAASNQKIQYGSDPIQQLQLYLPPIHNSDTKVILMVHGGGWIVGYNETAKVTTFDGRYGWDILNPLLEEGYACAVMKYRTACYQEDPTLSTGNTMRYLEPMMEDIDLAINTLKSRAGELQISSTHFQLLGESAGGHIVLSYAIREDADPALVSAVSMFGPTTLDDYSWKRTLDSLDTEYPEGILVDGINYFRTFENSCELETNKYLHLVTEMRSFGDHDTVRIDEENEYLQDLSPSSLYNIETETPLFIMHGQDDPLVPVSQADLMYEAFLSKFPDTELTADGAYNGTLKKSLYDNCGHGWEGSGCQKNTIMNDIVKWMNAH